MKQLVKSSKLKQTRKEYINKVFELYQADKISYDEFIREVAINVHNQVIDQETIAYYFTKLSELLKPIVDFGDTNQIQEDLRKVFNARWFETPEHYKEENNSFWLLYLFWMH